MCEKDDLSDIEEGTVKGINELVRLPAKSVERYEVTFKKYEEWCKEMGTKEEELTNEKVLISYFNNLISKDFKPTTLWSNYSMIRSMVAVNKNVDISKYSNLLALLKRKSAGYKPKKSKTFERHDVKKFLSEANDDEFLLTKVAFIIGLAGACKKKELTDLTTDNVKDKGDYFHILLQSAKMKCSRDFVVTAGNIEGVNLVDLIRKYINLRPWVEHNRFFVQYSNGICNRHPVGINTLGGLSTKIAKHLKLKNPDQYTGHCLKRSCTLLLAGAGADISTIKRHGGWKASLEAEGYFFSSVENKQRIAAKILGKNKNNTDFTSSWVDEAEIVHISLKPSPTYQAEGTEEIDMVMEPIEYTIKQRIAQFSPLSGATSLRQKIYNEECYRENFIKVETCSSTDVDSMSDCMDTEEGNGFCEELNSAESTSLTSPENLELVHLDKMDKLVNNGRYCNGFSNMPVNSNNVLQVKSLNTLNSVAQSDISFNPYLESHVNKIVSQMLHVQDTHQDVEFVRVPGVTKQLLSESKSQIPATPCSSNSAQDETTLKINSSVAEHVSVESVAKKVMQKLLSSASSNSQVLSDVLQSSVLKNQKGKQAPLPVVNKTVGKSPHSEDHTLNQIQDIGSKVLRMFVIDKQIEELRQEKKDIYKEIFSIGEISSSLFNSWAQEKIQRKNNGNIGFK